MSDRTLFAEFPPVTTHQWEEVIQADLKGADYDKKLVWRTQEGFSVRPYYRSENLGSLKYLNALPASFPFVRGRSAFRNNWEIRQDIFIKDGKEANAEAVDALSKGASAVGFVCKDKAMAGRIDVCALIKGISLASNPVHFDVGIHSPYVLASFLEQAKIQGVPEPKGSVNYDPLGRLASCGCYYGKEEFPLDTLRQLLDAVVAVPDFRVIGVDAFVFQNSGATLVQELAYALAIGAEYLSALTQAGYDAGDVAPKMTFNFAAGSNYFMEIAKIRAARLLWANLVKAYNPCSEDRCAMYVHSVTALWNKTVYDPYVNLLRTTTEAMSAVLGGADALTVLPFDVAYKSSDDFSERIARNQQVIIKEEAHMDKSADPAGGSYYIETLTLSLADAAWKLFLEIDEMGGYTQAMREGLIQGQVAESASRKRAAVATRRDILLGTNQYASGNETVASQIDESKVCKETCTCVQSKVVAVIPEFRLAEDFEILRLRTERSGKRPRVFMLSLGDLTMRKARAGFAGNYFSVAGFEILDNNGFGTLEEGVSEAVKSGAEVVVLCSSDDEYVTLAPKAVSLIQGKALFVLAGYPKAIVEDLKAAGVEHFIFSGQNVLEALQGYQKLLGL